jgi:hypothetical protein
MISVNQDPLGQAGKRVGKRKEDGLEIWARALSENKMAVVLYNPNSVGVIDVAIDLLLLSDVILGLSIWENTAMLQVKDVWTGQYMVLDGRAALHKEIAQTSCSFLIVNAVTSTDSFQEEII